MKPLLATSSKQQLADGTLVLPNVERHRVRVIVERHLTMCRENNLSEVRIIHNRRNESTRTIQSVLKEMPKVACFWSNGVVEGCGALPRWYCSHPTSNLLVGIAFTNS